MNKLVHQSSQPCAKQELDLFTTPATQEMILSDKWVDIHPIGFSLQMVMYLYFLKLKGVMIILM